MPRYFKDAEAATIRQYEEIIAMTDDVMQIASHLNISSEIILKVKEHIFINQHTLDMPDSERNCTVPFRGNFTPDAEIANLWLKAKNGTLQSREVVRFKRLIAHEYVERGLMEEGLPYRSPQAWRENPQSGIFAYWPTPEHHGAHDLAPNPSRPDPFSHWDKIIGKSPDGLTVADDLSNLDELIEAITDQI
ncbi:hypothetical protein [Laspinema palackyanum]|uniref:hypothetical protein n=1 Tax=Laspinema palackyanum TaxID=3231601 RepID=UPI00345C8500|nr:hypothetical protein [Laspinema sp. D2c]